MRWGEGMFRSLRCLYQIQVGSERNWTREVVGKCILWYDPDTCGERLRILGIGVFGLAFLLIFILILGGAVRRITCNDCWLGLAILLTTKERGITSVVDKFAQCFCLTITSGFLGNRMDTRHPYGNTRSAKMYFKISWWRYQTRRFFGNSSRLKTYLAQKISKFIGSPNLWGLPNGSGNAKPQLRR